MILTDSLADAYSISRMSGSYWWCLNPKVEITCAFASKFFDADSPCFVNPSGDTGDWTAWLERGSKDFNPTSQLCRKDFSTYISVDKNWDSYWDQVRLADRKGHMTKRGKQDV
jgi:hypothetical protein